MAVQFSVAVRNARLDAVEAAIGVSAKLQIYSGAMPASVATARSGSKLAEFALASDWAAAAANGSKNLNNLVLATTGIVGGTAGYWCIMDSAGTTCHMQGTVTATGGGGDMTIDNTSIAVSQPVNVTAFSMTDANA